MNDPMERLGLVMAELLAEVRLLRADMAQRTVAGEGVSSLAIEDMAKGSPKITSKTYDAPLTRSEIDAALNAHGYAHRRAEELAMDGWQQTVEALVGGNAL
jgi:hypothetical protein